MQFSLQQASWFRLRRSGLVTPFASPEEAAAALVGIQAQVVQPAALSLWNRTQGFHLEAFNDCLYTTRSLVKLWGQRNTLHLYPSAEWPLLYAAFKPLKTWWKRRLAREGKGQDALDDAVRCIAAQMKQGGLYSRTDLQDMDPDLDEWLPYANGVVMELVREGLACHAQPSGSKSRFAHRTAWLPDLAWQPPSADEASLTLARRYLSAYGPASPQDLAYWFGTTVTQARRWIEALSGEIVEVDLEGRSCWILPQDLDDLAEAPPPRPTWPIRLLNRFDPLLLGLKDKSWLIDPAHYKKVWREAAIVDATLLVGGRLEGTWRYERSAKGIAITITPFAPLSPAVRQALEKQAAGVAAFFGVPLLGFA